jgi:hypothetical protein
MPGTQDFYSDESRKSKPDIDLRQEMALILDKHGTWGLLRKRVRDRRCSCWNSNTEEARSDCPKCLGTGWAFVDHFIRYRKTSLVQLTEMPMPVGRAEGGSLMKFYMRSFVKPDRGDFIAELAQDEESLTRNYQIQPETPLTITALWDIQSVIDLREAGGRIEYWQALAEVADLGDTT